MDEVAPLNLLRIAARTQWPAMLLGVTVTLLSAAGYLGAMRSRWAHLGIVVKSPAMLISWPVYLWGLTAAIDSVRMFDLLAASRLNTMSWPNQFGWLGFGQFLALLVVVLPGTVTVLLRNPSVRARDCIGPIWAIAAVALDYLFLLVMVSPPMGGW